MLTFTHWFQGSVQNPHKPLQNIPCLQNCSRHQDLSTCVIMLKLLMCTLLDLVHVCSVLFTRHSPKCLFSSSMSLCHFLWHHCTWATPTCAFECVSLNADVSNVYKCAFCTSMWVSLWVCGSVHLCVFFRLRWPEDRCGCLAFHEPMSKTFSSVSDVSAASRKSCLVINK